MAQVYVIGKSAWNEICFVWWATCCDDRVTIKRRKSDESRNRFKIPGQLEKALGSNSKLRKSSETYLIHGRYLDISKTVANDRVVNWTCNVTEEEQEEN